MPLPKPKPSETTSDFISRCISFAVDEGMPQAQAVAACYTAARRAGRKVKPPPKKGDLDDLLQDNPSRFQTDSFGRSGDYVTKGVIAGEYPELGEGGKVPKRMSLGEQDDLDELLPIK